MAEKTKEQKLHEEKKAEKPVAKPEEKTEKAIENFEKPSKPSKFSKNDFEEKSRNRDYSKSSIETKKEEKSKKKQEIKTKKYEAVAHGVSAPISKKHSMYICSFIKYKPIDQAIEELTEVTKLKRAIPFKGEIPHRRELGGRPGRFPINASKYFIKLLKGLKGNAISNGLELEKTRIKWASATWDSRPLRSGGRATKRAYIILKAKEIAGENK